MQRLTEGERFSSASPKISRQRTMHEHSFYAVKVNIFQINNTIKSYFIVVIKMFNENSQ